MPNQSGATNTVHLNVDAKHNNGGAAVPPTSTKGDHTMIYSQYIRIETLAGGVACSNIQFIRALHTKISTLGKTRENREWRHKLIREGLEIKRNS